MPAVLITGVRGQDGHLLARALLEHGWTVHGTARRSEVDGVDPSGLTVHEADLGQPAVFGDLISRLEPDAVVNLAGISSVAESWRDPVTTSAVSGHAVAVLLDACRRVEDRIGRSIRFVQASSSEMFGHPAVSPQDESTPLQPINPYGAAKAYAHLLVRLHRAQGLFASNAILYNHESPRRPVAFVTRKITRGVAAIARGAQEPIVLGNLQSRRDWSWAPDVIDAIRLILEADEPDDFVVASGRARSVADFVATAFSAVGIDDWERHVSIDEELIRPSDAVESTGDSSRIRERLGWAPTVSFDEMVRRMVEHDLAELDS